MNLTLSEIPKTGFLASQPKLREGKRAMEAKDCSPESWFRRKCSKIGSIFSSGSHYVLGLVILEGLFKELSIYGSVHT